MADTPAVAPQEDPFDLGNTDLTFPKETPAETPALPPRGPDGKFTKPEEATPAVAPRHPEFLVRQATEFGLDESDIAEMPTSVLYKTVNRFLVRDREIATQFATARSLEDGRVKQPAPEIPKEQEVDDLAVMELEGVHPAIVAALRKNRSGTDKIKQLEDKLAAREQADAMREINSGGELIDFALSQIKHPLLGEGTGIELQADPARKAELQRRFAVLNAAGITDLRKVNRLTIVKQLKDAAELLFGAATPAADPADPYSAALNGKTAPPTKPVISPEDWANGGVARPSRRNGSPELKGDALAIKNLTERLRQTDALHTDQAELEGIPD